MGRLSLCIQGKNYKDPNLNALLNYDTFKKKQISGRQQEG